MRKLIYSLFALFFAMVSFAQDNWMHPDSVMRQDPRHSQMMFEEGELIVRFQDDVHVNIQRTEGMIYTGLSEIDALLQEVGLHTVKKLLSQAEPQQSRQTIRTFTGLEIEVPNLYNIYLFTVDQDRMQFHQLIHALNEQPEVVYAEPNYIYSHTVEHVGSVYTAEEYIISNIQLPTKSKVQLPIYNMYERCINLMSQSVFESGRHQLRFSRQQMSVTKGLYFIKVQASPLDNNELPVRKKVKLLII